jgi:ferredoxin
MTLKKLGELAGLARNFFRRPVTVREDFGFVSEHFRWLPRRDPDRCTGCGACNERCSSGATSITDSGDARTISIDGMRCIFCGRCADACPEHALELTVGPVAGDDTRRISLSRGSEEPRPTVDTTLKLQRCVVCGEVMPVTEKYLDAIKARTLRNLKPENAAIVEKDMERYLRVCIACRRKYSLEWDTHPRKFI